MIPLGPVAFSNLRGISLSLSNSTHYFASNVNVPGTLSVNTINADVANINTVYYATSGLATDHLSARTVYVGEHLQIPVVSSSLLMSEGEIALLSGRNPMVITNGQPMFLDGNVTIHELRSVDIIADVAPNAFTEIFAIAPVVSAGYCYNLEFQAILSGLSDLSGATTWLQVSSETVLSNFAGVFRGATGPDVVETTFLSTADRLIIDVSNVSFQVTNPAPPAYTKRCINGSLRFDVISSTGTVDVLFAQTAGPSTVRVLPGSYLKLACLGAINADHTLGSYVAKRGDSTATLSNLLYNMSITHWNTISNLQYYTSILSSNVDALATDTSSALSRNADSNTMVSSASYTLFNTTIFDNTATIQTLSNSNAATSVTSVSDHVWNVHTSILSLSSSAWALSGSVSSKWIDLQQLILHVSAVSYNDSSASTNGWSSISGISSGLYTISDAQWQGATGTLPSISGNEGKTLYFNGTSVTWLSVATTAVSTKTISQTSYTTLPTDTIVLVNDSPNTSVIVSLVTTGMIDGQSITIKKATSTIDKTVAVVLKMSNDTVTSTYTISLSNGFVTAMYSNAISGYLVVSSELGTLDPPRGSIPNAFTIGGTSVFPMDASFVTINGTSLLTVSEVDVGGAYATIVDKSSTAIAALLPTVVEPGYRDIKLIDYWGGSRTLTSGIRYEPFLSTRGVGYDYKEPLLAYGVTTNVGTGYKFTYLWTVTRDERGFGVGTNPAYNNPDFGYTPRPAIDRQNGKYGLIPIYGNVPRYFDDFCWNIVDATSVLSKRWTAFQTSPSGNYVIGAAMNDNLYYASPISVQNISMVSFAPSTIVSSNAPNYSFVSANCVEMINTMSLGLSGSVITQVNEYISVGSGTGYTLLPGGLTTYAGVDTIQTNKENYFESSANKTFNFLSNGGMTVMFTFYMADDTGNQTIWYSSKSSTNLYDAIHIYVENTNVYIRVYNGGDDTTDGTVVLNFVANRPIRPGWNQFIFTTAASSGSVPTAYCNGNNTNGGYGYTGGSLTQALTNRTNTVHRIGAQADTFSGDKSFDIKITSVYIWDRQLSNTELVQMTTWMNVFDVTDMQIDDAGNGLAVLSPDPAAVYRTVNGGQTWTQTNQNAYGNITGVAVGNNGCMYMCTYGGYLYSSTDYGATWTQRGTLQNYTCIGTDMSGRYVIAATPTNYYVSYDYGVTFAARTLPETLIMDLIKLGTVSIAPDASLANIFSSNGQFVSVF